MDIIVASRSAFVSRRVILGIGFCVIGFSLALKAIALSSAAAPSTNESPGQSLSMQVGVSYHNDVSPPLRDLVSIWPPKGKGEDELAEANLNPQIPNNHIDTEDPVVQDSFYLRNLAPSFPNIPSTGLNFDGIPFPGVGCNCAPPDTNGAVGATQYVQSVNRGYQVFNKTTGASVLGPLDIRYALEWFRGRLSEQWSWRSSSAL